MIVAIVHYHLRRGGVTRVIENALRALPDSIQPVVVCGEPPPDGSASWPCPVCVVDGLGYDRPTPTRTPDELARAMSTSVREAVARPPDLWHIHNHSLGKNASLTGAVSTLAREGHRLLLQIHDFPEDGRPSNYAHLVGHTDLPLYPAAPQIQYAVINPRDGIFLRRAGLPSTHCHALPNAVWVDAVESPDPGPDADLILYPTRAIRRKNLGEFLLWAAAAEPGQRFAVTLAPENPVARRHYDRWVEVSRDLQLPVTFELGTTTSGSFAALVRSARAVATTSVAEGFGLAFLEPWLLGRPLAGRDLPEVTDEFKQAGVQLPGLYPRLDIPVEQVDLPTLRNRLRAALTGTYQAYRRMAPAGAVDQALDAMIHDGHIDFGRLDEPEQERVLRRFSPRDALTTRLPPGQVSENARIIAKQYSLARYGCRLRNIYEHLVESDTGPVGALTASALLDAFLNPARFNLLRT